MTTAEFIQEYREKDTRQLALQSARFPDVDMPYALDQIKGWQTARRKLPTWAACDGIVYPPHLSMEQCSSEPTAQYKLNLAMEWASRVESSELRVESFEGGVESSENEVESLEGGVESSEREVGSSEFRVENSEGEVNNFSSGQPATLNSQLSTLTTSPQHHLTIFHRHWQGAARPAHAHRSVQPHRSPPYIIYRYQSEPERAQPQPRSRGALQARRQHRRGEDMRTAALRDSARSGESRLCCHLLPPHTLHRRTHHCCGSARSRSAHHLQSQSADTGRLR